MRLLIINKLYHPWIGGIETVVRDMAEGLRERGIVTSVLACQPRGRRHEETINGVSVSKAASFGIFLGMPISFDFMRLFWQHSRSADLILLHHPFPLGFLAVWLFARRKPIAVWYHADIVRQKITGRLVAPLLRRILKRAVKIFVADEAIITSSRTLVPFRDKCIIIPFGIDVTRYVTTPEISTTAAEIRRRYGTPLILAVGRLVPYKGFGVLIEAMRDIDASLLIIGSGQLRAQLVQQIASLRLAMTFPPSVIARTRTSEAISRGRITIIDPVSDLVPYYHAADVYVVPSIAMTEAFGLTQLEAMACGTPVINTVLATAVPKVSVHEETGLTVPPNDVTALAEAIKTLLVDPIRRQQYGAQGRARVRQHYSQDQFLKRLCNHIVIASRREAISDKLITSPSPSPYAKMCESEFLDQTKVIGGQCNTCHSEIFAVWLQDQRRRQD